jgi:hypothetical protein
VAGWYHVGSDLGNLNLFIHLPLYIPSGSIIYMTTLISQWVNLNGSMPSQGYDYITNDPVLIICLLPIDRISGYINGSPLAAPAWQLDVNPTQIQLIPRIFQVLDPCFCGPTEKNG